MFVNDDKPRQTNALQVAKGCLLRRGRFTANPLNGTLCDTMVQNKPPRDMLLSTQSLLRNACVLLAHPQGTALHRTSDWSKVAQQHWRKHVPSTPVKKGRQEAHKVHTRLRAYKRTSCRQPTVGLVQCSVPGQLLRSCLPAICLDICKPGARTKVYADRFSALPGHTLFRTKLSNINQDFAH